MSVAVGGTPDTCEKFGPIWQAYCELIDIDYPDEKVWPSDLQWYHLDAYRVQLFDVLLVVFFAALLTQLRYLVQRWSFAKAKSLKLKDAHKFSESIWKTAFYSTSFLWGFYLIAAREFVWALSFEEAFLHVPHLYMNPHLIDADIYYFYIFQIGFYAHSIYAHVFVETRRKDFAQMLLHHVATLGLVAISFTTRFCAIGTVIVAMHDLSDVLFEIAKLYVYVKNELLANLWFAVWVLSWILLRLTYFPLFVLRASVYKSSSLLGSYPHYFTCSMMLIILQCLHIFWFFMIASMIVRLARGTADRIEDTREDEEDDASATSASKSSKANNSNDTNNDKTTKQTAAKRPSAKKEQ